MAKRTKELGLGRGLNALLGDPDLQAQGEGSVSLPISQVQPGLNQPRKRFDQDALADLAESIRVHGIIQPLTVPPATTRSSPVSDAGGPPSWPAWRRCRQSSLRRMTAK